MNQSVYIAYWQSPLGLIEIKSKGDALISVHLCKESMDSASLKVFTQPVVISQCICELEAYFKGTLTHFTVKLAPEGTAFQQKVWRALREIPYGETYTYAQLAEKIGNPRACRAVGGANHNNPLWIVVPCHRVIGANGSLTGYASGIKVKAWLLKHEKEHVEKD